MDLSQDAQRPAVASARSRCVYCERWESRREARLCEGLKSRSSYLVVGKLLAKISAIVCELSSLPPDIRVSKDTGGGPPVGFPVRSDVSKRYSVPASLKSFGLSCYHRIQH